MVGVEFGVDNVVVVVVVLAADSQLPSHLLRMVNRDVVAYAYLRWIRYFGKEGVLGPVD